eukprot:25034_1
MSNFDQFSLWLNNRLLLDEIDEDNLNAHASEIFKFFGGFKELIKHRIGTTYESQLQTEQNLFQLLSDIKSEEESNNILTITLDTMHTDPMSHIFTFLSHKDHCALMRSCRNLTITGRKKHSCFNKNTPPHLQLIHSLPHFKTILRSDNIQQQEDVMNSINKICFEGRKDKTRAKILACQSNITLDIFRCFEISSNYPLSSINALKLYLKFEPNLWSYHDGHLSVKSKTALKLLTQYLQTKKPPIIIECINCLDITHQKILSYLNRKNTIHILIAFCKLHWKTDEHQRLFRYVLPLIYNLLRHKSFKWNEQKNIKILRLLILILFKSISHARPSPNFGNIWLSMCSILAICEQKNSNILVHISDVIVQNALANVIHERGVYFRSGGFDDGTLRRIYRINPNIFSNQQCLSTLGFKTFREFLKSKKSEFIRDLCRIQKMKVSGTKKDLIHRLLNQNCSTNKRKTRKK